MMTNDCSACNAGIVERCQLCVSIMGTYTRSFKDLKCFEEGTFDENTFHKQEQEWSELATATLNMEDRHLVTCPCSKPTMISLVTEKIERIPRNLVQRGSKKNRVLVGRTIDYFEKGANCIVDLNDIKAMALLSELSEDLIKDETDVEWGTKGASLMNTRLLVEGGDHAQFAFFSDRSQCGCISKFHPRVAHSSVVALCSFCKNTFKSKDLLVCASCQYVQRCVFVSGS